MRPTRSTFTEARFSQLLLKLYETPLTPERWPAFLADFSSVLGLPALAIHHHDLRQHAYHFNVSTGMDASSVSDYEKHFGRLDPYRRQFESQRTGFSLGEALCPTRELKKTEFYCDFLARHAMPLGVYAAASTARQPGNLQVITAYRRLADDPPDRQAADVFKLMVPHLRSALHLKHQVGDLLKDRSCFEAAVDALHVAALLLDEQGLVVDANPPALELISGAQGVRLRLGQLLVRNPAEHAALARLIAQIVSGFTDDYSHPLAPVTISSGAESALRFTGAPLSRSDAISVAGTRRCAAILFIRDEGRTLRFSASLVQSRYRLTRAETLLAMRLFEGHSLRDIAAANGVAFETVRSQLKAVFLKTGTHRQSQLLQLLSQLAAAR